MGIDIVFDAIDVERVGRGVVMAECPDQLDLSGFIHAESAGHVAFRRPGMCVEERLARVRKHSA